MNGNYTRLLKEYDFGDLIPVEKWLKECENGMFIDYDGSGYAVKDDMVDLTKIYPSTRKSLPDDATHVIWFNK